MKLMLRILLLLAILYAVLVAVVYFRQRSMLFFPSHTTPDTRLTPWMDDTRLIGYCREVPGAPTIWLMMHGNAGQAADREYVLPRLSGQDSLYVLEYPGYGAREGSPSMDAINQAASEAYELLRKRHPNTPVCVLAESIGSGPACVLAREKVPPDKIVLVVPFDTLANVAAKHFPLLPVRLLLRDTWNNVEALRNHSGPVEIFAATEDNVIPISHAKTLANQVPGVQFTAITGGHNEWSDNPQVKIAR